MNIIREVNKFEMLTFNKAKSVDSPSISRSVLSKKSTSLRPQEGKLISLKTSKMLKTDFDSFTV